MEEEGEEEGRRSRGGRKGGDDDAILRNSGELNTHFEKCAPSRRVTKRGGRERERERERPSKEEAFQGNNGLRKWGHQRLNFMMSLREVEFQFDEGRQET